MESRLGLLIFGNPHMSSKVKRAPVQLLDTCFQSGSKRGFPNSCRRISQDCNTSMPQGRTQSQIQPRGSNYPIFKASGSRNLPVPLMLLRSETQTGYLDLLGNSMDSTRACGPGKTPAGLHNAGPHDRGHHDGGLVALPAAL